MDTQVDSTEPLTQEYVDKKFNFFFNITLRGNFMIVLKLLKIVDDFRTGWVLNG